MTKNLVPVFFDSFENKNRLQLQCMQRLGFRPHWFQTAVSKKDGVEDMHILKPGLFARLAQVLSFFFRHRAAIHHIEIYPGGRFSFIYLMLARVFRIPVLCAERGDIYFAFHKKYDRFTRWSMNMVYRFADYLWLRELFAADYLEEMKMLRPYFFIHNVVPIPPAEQVTAWHNRDIDFLWVNSLKSFRRVEWFTSALQQAELSDTHNVLLGITESALRNEYARVDALPNLDVKGFIAPAEYYRKAKFFVMPASIVYLNHALLEAMSYGVVPIITRAQGAELIIDHDVNGFITAYDEASFTTAMKQAHSLDDAAYQKLSEAAREKVISDYSETYYFNALKNMYETIGAGRQPDMEVSARH